MFFSINTHKALRITTSTWNALSQPSPTPSSISLPSASLSILHFHSKNNRHKADGNQMPTQRCHTSCPVPSVRHRKGKRVNWQHNFHLFARPLIKKACSSSSCPVLRQFRSNSQLWPQYEARLAAAYQHTAQSEDLTQWNWRVDRDGIAVVYVILKLNLCLLPFSSESFVLSSDLISRKLKIKIILT
jgi:hypothetical protein